MARVRLWAALAVAAAVPVGVLASGGGGTVGSVPATTLAAAGVRAASTTSPDLGGAGDVLCPVLPAASCTDTGSGGDGDSADTSSGGATESTSDVSTTSGPGALPAPPQGACDIAPVPGVCSRSTTSSTVTVAPPRSRHSHTTTDRTSRTRTRTESTTTVTVTVTQGPSTGAATTTSTRTGTT